MGHEKMLKLASKLRNVGCHDSATFSVWRSCILLPGHVLKFRRQLSGSVYICRFLGTMPAAGSHVLVRRGCHIGTGASRSQLQGE